MFSRFFEKQHFKKIWYSRLDIKGNFFEIYSCVYIVKNYFVEILQKSTKLYFLILYKILCIYVQKFQNKIIPKLSLFWRRGFVT